VPLDGQYGRLGQSWDDVGTRLLGSARGLFVPAESAIRTPEGLAGVDIAVGYHSGSHFSTLQALENILKPDAISLRFGGGPLDRLALLLDRAVPAANLFGIPYYIAEQQGFRRVLDTTFMIGFLSTGDATVEDLTKYFRALERAQGDIDLEAERYKHYFLREMPEKYHDMVDVRAFGHGERVVFEKYTREMYEQTHRWTLDLGVFKPEQVGNQSFENAVLVWNRPSADRREEGRFLSPVLALLSSSRSSGATIMCRSVSEANRLTVPR